MKKFLSTALLFVLTITLLLTSCGKKEVKAINITEGFKYEYELGETPDFSAVKATIVYNDDTTREVTGAELTFGTVDTTTAGKKDVSVSYEGFTTTYQVTVKSKSIETVTKELTSIEYLSGIPANVYAGDTVNFDDVSIVLNYSDGSRETKTLSSNANIKHNGAEIDTTVAGEKTLTITFMGKSLNVTIDVKAVVVTALEIQSADNTIVEGTEFDPTGMKVYAVFNNGSKILVETSKLTIEQDEDKVTITYNGVSAELLLNVEDPTVTAMTLNTTAFNATILVGDTVDTAGVFATGALNNGFSRAITNAELSFSAVDTSVAGAYTITATYTVDSTITATFDVTVLGIKSIEIDASSVKTFIPAGSALDTTNIKILITASDDSIHTRTAADGVTTDFTNLDTATINEESYITATFRGVTSQKLGVVVHDPDLAYSIFDLDLPASLSSLESKKKQFINKEYGYVVGDDNPFIFKLALTILNDAGVLVENYSNYKSYFEIYEVGENGALTLLEGDSLATYVDEINANNNSVDFTQAAVGKFFTIKTRPADGIADSDITAMTREITVEVVDAFNIYEAWELNYLTNSVSVDASDFGDWLTNHDGRNQIQVVDDFLLTKNGATRPASMAGVVLHNDLTIERTDIPAEYFLNGNRDNTIGEWLTIFPHGTDNTNKTFTFYGNYFTIFSYKIPNVCENSTGNQNDYTSSSQLFRFTCNEAVDGTFDHTQYTTNIQNLYLRDDNPNKDDDATAGRDMLGIIGMKVQRQLVNVTNIRVEAYYISFFADGDYTTIELDQCKFYNSYQNHIYSYNKNGLQADGEDPLANYAPITINVKNSEITKCGGPVILNQIEGPQFNKNSKSGPQITIDDNTEIWTYVTGQEAWFKATGSAGIAAQISSLGLGLVQAGAPKTIVSPTGEDGFTAGENVYFMNMIMVNIVSSSDINEVLGNTHDLDAKFTVGDKTYLNMNDEYTDPYGQGYGYGDPNVLAKFLESGGKNTMVNTYTGGTIVIDENNNIEMINPQYLADGDYAAIYFATFGFVFGYAPFN